MDHLRQVGIRGFIAEHTNDADFARAGKGSDQTARDGTATRRHQTTRSEPMEDGLVAANPCSIKGAGVEPTMHRLGHASAAAALRYQHATAQRDEAIADGIDRLLGAANKQTAPSILAFRGRSQKAAH